MNLLLKRFLIIIAASLLAIISYYFLLSWRWLNIIPWAFSAFIIGYISKGKKDAMINGAIFGYFLSLVYILYNYTGKSDIQDLIKIISFSLFFSLIGATGGIIGAFIGNTFKMKISKPHNSA